MTDALWVCHGKLGDQSWMASGHENLMDHVGELKMELRFDVYQPCRMKVIAFKVRLVTCTHPTGRLDRGVCSSCRSIDCTDAIRSCHEVAPVCHRQSGHGSDCQGRDDSCSTTRTSLEHTASNYPNASEDSRNDSSKHSNV